MMNKGGNWFHEKHGFCNCKDSLVLVFSTSKHNTVDAAQLAFRRIRNGIQPYGTHGNEATNNNE